MKTLNIFATAALLSTALFAASANASQGYDQYRRVVLGDTTLAAPAVAGATRTEAVPGSYAQYLINNGANKSEAVAAAARIGEQVSYRSVAVEAPQRQLTPAQAYAKYLGNDDFASRTNQVGNAE